MFNSLMQHSSGHLDDEKALNFKPTVSISQRQDTSSVGLSQALCQAKQSDKSSQSVAETRTLFEMVGRGLAES